MNSEETEIFLTRQFPLTGTYIGTIIDVPEPADRAEWYQWNQAKMAAHAVRYTVITGGTTEMVEHLNPQDRLRVDVYAQPPLGIQEHIAVEAQHIAEDMDKKLDSLGIEPEFRPIWFPLGQQALEGVVVDYSLNNDDEENDDPDSE